MFGLEKENELVTKKECRDQQKTRIKQTYALELKYISSSKDYSTNFSIRNLKYRHDINNNSSKIKLI